MDDPSSPSLSAANGEPYWNPSRKEIHAWLMAKAPELGNVFEGSLKILYTKGFPGKVRFICHAVREIRNRLPDIIAGQGTSSRVQYDQKIDKILKVCEDLRFSIDDVSQEILDEAKEPSLTVSLPYPVYKLTCLLFKEHKGRKTRADAAIRLFEEIAPENKGAGEVLSPVIVQWLDHTEWFMERAHIPITGVSISEEELFEKFVLFETMLANLIRGFFKTSRSLDEILEDTNG